ncbi:MULTISPECIES: sensor histidine kinase [Delftia]|jgi:signal transduction histidine kinase|uniref:histidine kinase n=3 Tax=Pseudomonadati TaxID=3379134 RepID=A9C0G5_DELAS|nr:MULTISPECIES: ATP-binding protein [Delftia]MBA4002570.1 two-component sensor histidine kinase [Delftia sp.]PIF37072.1 signal transduction histidine kinase [Burkholderiales bacterium 23]ABX37038.1 histidine kinase [Delftia acidovorans SPH-1]ATH16051.1 two-component sensor histidine kinase [Delftia acidovorans]KFJ08562.1 his Kinase A domain protein [Delftia acidovorans]
MNEDDLKAELELCRAEIRSLREELDETNRGVVALYGELDVQAEKLRKATELKSHFLSYMSHEFRTPIGAIRSNARLLLDHVDGPLTTEQTRQVGFIQETAAEFSEMVNDLLDLAKIEAGRLEISPGWFEMMDLFAALRGMFKAMADNVELSLVFEEPGDLPRFYTDNRKLSQILRNFISNALKFTPQGEIKVSAELVGDMLVKFSVADTGIGIASEFHDAIFNDFTQVDSPIQKRLRGTGLGLALSKQLAQLLGGWVEVQSALGEGSTFSVIVPAHLPVDTKDLKA